MTPPRVARINRLTALTLGAGAIAVAAAALWAARPSLELDLPPVPSTAAPTVDQPTTAEVPPSRLPGFMNRLSPAPPEVAKATLKAEPIESPIAQRVELLGIARDGDTLVAALYDPADDRVHLVRDGESIAGVDVRKVEAHRVLLAKGDRVRTLSLSAPRPPAGSSRAGSKPTSSDGRSPKDAGAGAGGDG